MNQNRIRHRVVTLAFALAVAYGIACGGVYYAMKRPPEEFGKIMARVPMPAMAVLPFEALWNVARAGDLRPGDVAPDFALPAREGKEVVQLSKFRGRPVVLIFGSYT
jgi:hypothetical protein